MGVRGFTDWHGRKRTCTDRQGTPFSEVSAYVKIAAGGVGQILGQATEAKEKRLWKYWSRFVSYYICSEQPFLLLKIENILVLVFSGQHFYLIIRLYIRGQY